MRVHVGCCGWGNLQLGAIGEGPDWKSRYPHKLSLYAKHFDLVEINSTFYRLPQEKTAARWLKLARAANPSFAFAVKVNQVITHLDRFASERSLKTYTATKRIAAALRAKILLFQTPPSFRTSMENLARLRRFFEEIDRSGLVIVFEPRGWEEKALEPLLRDLCLVHGVDPFVGRPLTAGCAYLRLHGCPPGERMYRYDYTREDLLGLARSLAALESEEVYVLFNNDHMMENALAFKEMLKSEGKGPR